MRFPRCGRLVPSQILRRREVAGDRGCGRNPWAHQMGASALALPALEVAVAGRGAPLAGGKDVVVHPKTHRTAGAAPVEPGRTEDLVEALLLGLDLDGDAAGNDQRAHPVGDAAAAHNLGGDAQVLDPGVRTRPDEHRVGADVADRPAWLER